MKKELFYDLKIQIQENYTSIEVQKDAEEKFDLKPFKLNEINFAEAEILF